MALAMSIIFALPADMASTWRLVTMPYSTAAMPHAMAMSTTFIASFP
jgi:hypothetical protein